MRRWRSNIVGSMEKFWRTVLLAAVVSLAGCVNFNRLELTAFHVDSVTPAGFRSVTGVATATVDNRSVGFTVYDIGGTVRHEGRELGNFSVEPVTVRARSEGDYTLNAEMSLSQGVSLVGLLGMLQNFDMDDLTVDVFLTVKAKGRAPQKFRMKDIPVRRVMDIMRSGNI